MQNSSCPRGLADQVHQLSAAAADVDYDDPAQEAALYAAARPVLDAVATQRTSCVMGFRMKAQAVAWCAGGALFLGPNATLMERLVDSLLRDLLACPAAACGTCRPLEQS